MQYDSLSNILDLVADAKRRLSMNDWDELRDVLDEISSLVSEYANVLKE